jgi:Mrp family chromosome partitioning ATPase
MAANESAPTNDITPPSLTRVHVVKPLPGDDGAPPLPLQIDYAATRVLPAAAARLQRVPGIVKPDRSALSEAFKMLRNQVLQRLRADDHKLLAVTSPRRLQGKSLAAVNLALALAADLDTAVLLVDADFGRRETQHLFGLDDEPGLVEHLTLGTPLPELLLNPGIERFVLLPAGRGPVQNSAELLATKALQHLVREMKSRYADRLIVVDLPPLLDSADALAFLPQVDTTLVVVEEQGTSLRDVEAATELLAPFNLIGTVLAPAVDTPRRRWWGGRMSERATDRTP